MKIAITGGTGFAGRHLARALVSQGHEVVLIARGRDARDPSIRLEPRTTFVAGGVTDRETLDRAFAGCDAVAHFAGINREIGDQTFARIHVEGTAAVVQCAERAGVRKIVHLSFLRARPRCGSAYCETKWGAEEIVRGSALDFTILRSSVIYGRGDHMLDHLSRAFYTLPVFPLVGLSERRMRPVVIHDVVRLAVAALVGGEMSRQTVAVLGPEELTLGEAVRRVAVATGRVPLFIRLPVWMHFAMAWGFERVMTVPILALAQVRILAEGLIEPSRGAVLPPSGLAPRTPFAQSAIRAELPGPGGFGLSDLRLCAATRR
jgi:NADH dehydrogenase